MATPIPMADPGGLGGTIPAAPGVGGTAPEPKVIGQSEWKTIGTFIALMVALSLFDAGLAKWIMIVAAIVLVIRHPQVISNPF